MAIWGAISAGASLLSSVGNLFDSGDAEEQARQAAKEAERAYKAAYQATQARYQQASSLWDTALTYLGKDFYQPGTSPLAQRVAEAEQQLASIQTQRKTLEKELAKKKKTWLSEWLYADQIKGIEQTLGQFAEQEATLKAIAEQAKLAEQQIYSRPSQADYAYRQLERAKTRDVSKAMQQLISSGLATTEAATYLPMEWETQVGAQARAGIEQQRLGAWLSAIQGKAGLIGSVVDQYPDYQMLAAQAAQVGAQPSIWSQLPGIVASGQQLWEALT